MKQVVGLIVGGWLADIQMLGHKVIRNALRRAHLEERRLSNEYKKLIERAGAR